MNRQVVFHPEAEDELHDATSYYDAESPDLGHALLEDLESAIAQITQYPESSPLVSTLVRRKPLRRFPYSIMYLALPGAIRILSFRIRNAALSIGVTASEQALMTVECHKAHPDRTINLVTWEEFEEKLKELRRERGPHSSGLLFRGQENFGWLLKTTLERSPVEREMSFQDYYETIYRAKPAIESYTEKSWDIPDPHEVGSLTARVEPFVSFTAEEYKTWGRVFSYMVYLRHHGFPSPFLDWTLSPYIAAFFAFRGPVKGEKVSIYAYREMPNAREKPKVFSSAKPTIYNLPEQYVRTHPRHFLQQCRYTFCAENNGGEWRFAPHEDVFARSDPNVDVRLKFDIPSTERLKVLRFLNDDCNINAFSLFQSEESLMETMALRELSGRLSESSS